jgi:hypothetical protein
LYEWKKDEGYLRRMIRNLAHFVYTFQLMHERETRMTTAGSAKDTAQGAQDQYFRLTDQVPEEVWYWAALGSIVASATLFAIGKRDWSIFVGQWPPTFLLFGLFHKLLRPSRY